MLVIRRTWLRLLDPLYALALVGMCDHLVRPEMTAAVWMLTASALALAFLFIGAASRIGSLAAAGQLFLLTAVIHFFRSVTGRAVGGGHSARGGFRDRPLDSRLVARGARAGRPAAPDAPAPGCVSLSTAGPAHADRCGRCPGGSAGARVDLPAPGYAGALD